MTNDERYKAINKLAEIYGCMIVRVREKRTGLLSVGLVVKELSRVCEAADQMGLYGLAVDRCENGSKIVYWPGLNPEGNPFA